MAEDFTLGQLKLARALPLELGGAVRRAYRKADTNGTPGVSRQEVDRYIGNAKAKTWLRSAVLDAQKQRDSGKTLAERSLWWAEMSFEKNPKLFAALPHERQVAFAKRVAAELRAGHAPWFIKRALLPSASALGHEKNSLTDVLLTQTPRALLSVFTQAPDALKHFSSANTELLLRHMSANKADWVAFAQFALQAQPHLSAGATALVKTILRSAADSPEWSVFEIVQKTQVAAAAYVYSD